MKAKLLFDRICNAYYSSIHNVRCGGNDTKTFMAFSEKKTIQHYPVMHVRSLSDFVNRLIKLVKVVN